MQFNRSAHLVNTFGTKGGLPADTVYLFKSAQLTETDQVICTSGCQVLLDTNDTNAQA